MKSVILALLNVNFVLVLSYVSQPELKDLNHGQTQIGEDIELECSTISYSPEASIQWKSPLNLKLDKNRVNITTTVQTVFPGGYSITSLYTILESRVEDGSIYYCTAIDPELPFDNTKYEYQWVQVYGANESVVAFYKDFTVFDKADLKINVYVKAYPETSFSWLDKNGNIVENSEKLITWTEYSNKFANYLTYLKFNSIDLKDFGNYSVVAQNEYETKTYSVLVNMTGPPSSKLEALSLNRYKCTSGAFPKPKITWEFEKCENLECFGSEYHQKDVKTIELEESNFDEHGLQIISYTSVDKSGIIKCVSTNTLGNDTTVQHIYRTTNDFEIFSKNMVKIENQLKLETLYNDTIEIFCAVSLDDYHEEIKWFKSGRNFSLDDIKVPIKQFREYDIRNFNGRHSSVSVLKLTVDKTSEGDYFCKASRAFADEKLASRVIKIEVKEQALLNVASNMDDSLVQVRYGKSYKFYCNAGGYPTPSVTWYKDDVIINSTDRIKIKKNNQVLDIQNIGPSDNATYKCEVENRIKNETRTAILEAIDSIEVSARENTFDWSSPSSIIIFLIIALVVVSVCAGVKIYKDNKRKKQLEAISLARFREEALEHINSAMTPETRTDLLAHQD